MQRQPGALGELVEEAREQVAAEPADARSREVDVRDDERPARRLERDVGERLVRGQRRGAVARDVALRAARPSASPSARRRPPPRPRRPPARARAAGRSRRTRRGARSGGRAREAGDDVAPPSAATATRTRCLAGGIHRSNEGIAVALSSSLREARAAPARLVAERSGWRDRRRRYPLLGASCDALDAGAERAQALVDPLVAAVDLADVADRRRRPRRRGSRSASPCRRGCPGSPCAGRRASPGPVTTARCGSQRMIRAPMLDELVDEEQPVLEHLLEDQDRAPRLRRDGERDRGEVGREGGPRAVLDLRDLVADVVLDHELLAGGHAHARVARSRRARRGARTPGRIGARSAATTSSIVISPPVTAARPMKLPTSMCSGRDPPLAAARALDALDAQDVRADALDPRAERDEEAAEILDVRLAGGVADDRLARGDGRAAMTAFSVAITLASSRKIARAAEAVGAHVVAAVELDLGAELCKRVDVRVEPAAADHVAAGRRHDGAAEAREQRPGEQERGADAAAELGVELGLVRAGSCRRRARSGPSTRRRRRRRRRARPSSRRRGCAGRSQSVTGSSVSRHAARIGSAPFLFPAARTSAARAAVRPR